MVGIKDIAKKTGYSISTVSYALNNSHKVSEATRAIIIKAADELHYVPNNAARTLKRNQSNIIGVFLADYSGAFYGELLHGIKLQLQKENYEMIVCSGEQSHRFIPEKLIDGAIILDAAFDDDEILRLADLDNNIVTMDRDIVHPRIGTVLLDNEGGTNAALTQLGQYDELPLYIVTGPEASYDSQSRYKTAKRWASENKREVNWIDGDFSRKSGQRAARQILSENSRYPITVFSFNDEMAVGMYKVFAKTDLLIGRDIKMVGFDNIEIASFLTPRLTTIGYSKYHWGIEAAKQIVAIIQNEDAAHKKVYTSLITGKSLEKES